MMIFIDNDHIVFSLTARASWNGENNAEEMLLHCFHCSDWLWRQRGRAAYMAWLGAIKCAASL